ncbi:unnamed protein product [Lepeophtheirus salmonis]|uniref:(salmon louse) hypothetical protein n=1 Tax=Lepeophtheirus salmonis TaxID=72036 RepID=A0A7R8CN02_LEPSM|nr:unnamed protein product [Lepeophtheirus salmonis]CAF2841934.1 unnamed protein product [Lepeophtheirus salmonis]
MINEISLCFKVLEEKVSIDRTRSNIQKMFCFIVQQTCLFLPSQILKNTAASVSVIPTHLNHRSRHPTSYLYAANSIKTSLKITLIGADFLSFYALVVEIKKRSLFDLVTLLGTSGTLSSSPTTGITAIASPNRFTSIVGEFASFTKPYYTTILLKHAVTHQIATTGAR